MFFQLPSDLAELPEQLQLLLDKNNPYPEASVARLCRLAAVTEDTFRGANFRRLVVDADSLMIDLRWHVAQALLILKAFPDLEKRESESVATFDRLGMPNRAWALLRPYVADTGRVFFVDLMERRGGGGTVAGWILHMLVDGAVFRAIGVLDRLAHLLILAADIPAPRNRMYFRSGKFENIEKSHGVVIPKAIADLAAGEEFTYLLNYRDGFAHTIRPTAKAMGTPPSDSYHAESGAEVRMPPMSLGAEDLFGISLLALHLCSEALAPVASFCESYIAVPDENAEFVRKVGSLSFSTSGNGQQE